MAWQWYIDGIPLVFLKPKKQIKRWGPGEQRILDE